MTTVNLLLSPLPSLGGGGVHTFEKRALKRKVGLINVMKGSNSLFFETTRRILHKNEPISILTHYYKSVFSVLISRKRLTIEVSALDELMVLSIERRSRYVTLPRWQNVWMTTNR